ncbi:DNA-3-methyladenine glycosylase I [Acidaminobacter hydrogenoformans]|uniref:DNA-3-methyladenine glycosylase I n=1 Tax=Acidaminobacter hydrogenoformans DSM 2784 TaxID=1120920 RepID=A0A1G5S578_9FIRM|nr:DNA-3-methyladenine glycosylase I [Acidaminobacter hydrogenoformans]SCZ81476.1 DNA-3-methyladenine glycosylase I [Acidaminobacter hydrogenoformans DSM 2784]
MSRCPWCLSDPIYIDYHDHEWGVPVYDDRVHFEFLVLESAQAGLSWLTILRKRDHYRRLYEGFDPVKVAAFGPEKVEAMLQDPGIVRNRKKIEASITNARIFLEIQHEFGSFSNYLWRFVDGRPLIHYPKTLEEVPCENSVSDAISRDLKSRGMKFLGTKIIYAHLQATGLINDHLVSCSRHEIVQRLSK